MSNESKKVTRAKARRGNTPKKTTSTINRRGGGTPPPQLITNRKRIVGIKNAMHDAMREQEAIPFEVMMNLEVALKFKPSKWIKPISDEEQQIFWRAIERAKSVKDWSKLPKEELGDEFFTTEAVRPRRKRQSLPGPKIISARRVRPLIETDPAPEVTTSIRTQPKSNAHLLVAAAARR